MTPTLSRFFAPVCALFIVACGADAGSGSDPTRSAPAGNEAAPLPSGVTSAEPVAVTALNHAAGTVYFAEVGDGVLVGEATDPQLGPSALGTLRRNGGTPLDLFITLSDDKPSEKLVQNHYALKSAAPTRLAIERTPSSKLEVEQAPCTFGSNLCAIAGQCSLSELRNTWSTTMGGSPTTQVVTFDVGQLTQGPFFDLGSAPMDLYFSSCSPTTAETYGIFIKPDSSSTWNSASVTLNPNVNLYLVYYDGLDKTNNLDFVISMSQPSKLAVLIADKPL